MAKQREQVSSVISQPIVVSSLLPSLLENFPPKLQEWNNVAKRLIQIVQKEVKLVLME